MESNKPIRPKARDWNEVIRSDPFDALLIETLGGARQAMAAPLAVAFVLVPAFWGAPDSTFANVVSAIIACIALGICGAAQLVSSLLGSRLSQTILHASVIVVAFSLSMALASISFFLFVDADGTQSFLIVACFLVSMLDVLLLGPIPAVSVAYMAPLLTIGAVGFGQARDGTSLIVLSLIAFTAALIFILRGRFFETAPRAVVQNAASTDGDQTIASLFDFEMDENEFFWEVDASRAFRNVSPRFSQATRRSTFELQGLDVSKLFEPCNAIDLMRIGKPFRNELVTLKISGASKCWRITGKPSYDHDGSCVGYRGIAADISEARAAELLTKRLATFDSLTDLANRVQFQTHSNEECAAAAADGKWRALFYLDLDGFKGINDRFGHAAGDTVLQEVARRLRACVPKKAVIARLGGDEFAIWYPVMTPTKAGLLADTIIKTVSGQFEIQGTPVDLSVSIGIAFTPKNGIEPVTLLGRADLALYHAKADGKGRWRAFIDEYETSVIERRKLLDDLKLALARQEFEIFYQPLVDLSRGRISTFEALVRWRSPTRGMVSPAAFIPIAESSNLISAIGEWVLFQACKEAARWPDDISVAVNVSPQQFRSPDFAQMVMLALLRTGLPANRLELEVTEGVFLDKSEVAIANLHVLKGKGVRIALDDFGTGYSSLSYLIDFPVDKIKIDQCFVRDCATRIENQAVIDAILAIAKKLSIRVTAEGVETAEQVIALKTRRCDDIQGFLISKPRPASDVPDMIASVPAAFREIVPMAFESPLGLALALKRQAQ